MRFTKSLILIAAATVAFAQDVIISRGFFVGKEIPTPGPPSPETYRNHRNHATAAASILKYAASKVDYAPKSQSPAKSQIAHEAFQKKVRQFPGFKADDSYHLSLTLKGGFSDLEEQILAQYPFSNEASVARQLRYAIPFSNWDEDLRTWEVSLVLIRKPMSEDNGGSTYTPVTVELIKLILDLDSKDGTVSVPSQTAKFVVEPFTVVPKFLEQNAEILFAKMGVTTIAEFGQYFRSRQALFPNIREWYGASLCDQDLF